MLIKHFEDLLRKDYSAYKVKRKFNKLEFYNGSKRIATLTLEGTYSGLFRDWRESKTYNLNTYLRQVKGMSAVSVRDFLKKEYGYEFDVKSFHNYTSQVNDKRALPKYSSPKIFLNSKFDVVNERSEKYLREVRGFKNLPKFILDRIEYDSFTGSIIFPLWDWDGNRVSFQKLQLDENGNKAGQKLLKKGGIFNSLWYAKGRSDNDTLVVAEGVETAISIADGISAVNGSECAKQFDYCARIGTRQIDIPKQYKTVILCIDNDKDDSPALRANNEFIEYLYSQGKAVITVNAICGEKGDFADLTSYERGLQFIPGCIDHIMNTNTANTKESVEIARKSLLDAFGSLFNQDKNALVKVDMGIGKTTKVVTFVASAAARGKKIAVSFQNHDILEQQLPLYEKYAKKYGLKIAIQKGRQQPNMCSNLVEVEAYIRAGQAPKIYCEKECPNRQKCALFGYFKNLGDIEIADIVLTTQANLTLKQDIERKYDIIVMDEIGDCKVFIKKEVFNFNENDLHYDLHKQFEDYIPIEIENVSNIFLGIWDIISNYIRTSKGSVFGRDIIDCISEYKELEFKIAIREYTEAIERLTKEIEELIKEKSCNEEKLLIEKKGNYKYKNLRLQKEIDEKLEVIKGIEDKISEKRKGFIKDVREVMLELEKNLILAKRKIFVKEKNVTNYPYFFQFFKKAILLTELVLKQLNNMEENVFIIYKENSGIVIEYFQDIHPSWGNCQRIIMDATPQSGYEKILGSDYEKVTIQAEAPYAKFHYRVRSHLSKSHMERAVESYREGIKNGEKSIYKATKASRLKTNVLDIFNIMYSHVHEDKETGFIVPKVFHDFMDSELCKDLTIPKGKILYFGNTRSKNDLKDVDVLCLVGNAMPKAEYFIRRHELFTGERVYDRDYSFDYKDQYASNGKKHNTLYLTHSNDMIAKDISDFVIAEYSQAIERCRTVNRTKDNPVDVYIYSNVYIQGYRFDSIESADESDDFYEQRHNGKITGGEDEIIFEEGHVAWRFHGERIRGKSCYQNKKFENSRNIIKALKDGYKPYLLKFKEWQNRQTRVLIPAKMSVDLALEYITTCLVNTARKNVENIELVPIELEMKVQEPTTIIYNRYNLSKFNYFRFLPMYNLFKKTIEEAGEGVYLSGMDLFKLPDWVRFTPEFIKEWRDIFKKCFYKTKKHIDLYKHLGNYGIEKRLAC